MLRVVSLKCHHLQPGVAKPLLCPACNTLWSLCFLYNVINRVFVVFAAYEAASDPALLVDNTQDSLVRWDSYENFNTGDDPLDHTGERLI